MRAESVITKLPCSP